MRLDAWMLAVVSAGTGEEPWAEIHGLRADALASVVKTFDARLAHLSDVDKTDEKAVSDALDEIAYFTIEPAIIDTDELAESE